MKNKSVVDSQKNTTLNTHAERSQLTQSRIIQAAIEVIETQGIQRASIFEIAKKADLTPGALQHHFTTKGDLIRRVAAEIVHADDENGNVRIWDADLRLQLAERANIAVSEAWRRMYSKPRYITMWSIFLSARSDPELIKFIAAERAKLSVRVRASFIATFPELRADPDSQSFTDTVISGMRGIGMLGMFGDDSARREAMLKHIGNNIVLYCNFLNSKSV
jgi:AcrR family transcriptional regulator